MLFEVPGPIPLDPGRDSMQIPGVDTPNRGICVEKSNFPSLTWKPSTLNPFFDILLLSPRPGNHLNTFLASFTSSGVESQPEWTNIHSIHASGGQSRVSSRRNPTLEHATGSTGSTGSSQSGFRKCCADPISTRAGGQDNGS